MNSPGDLIKDKEQRKAYQKMLNKLRKENKSAQDSPVNSPRDGQPIGSFLYEPKGEDLKKEETLRIVLIGKTGTGKSTTGNTIFNKEHFKTKVSGSCVTQDSKIVRGVSCGLDLAVIDTPGLCQPGYSDTVLMKKVAKGIAMTTPGPHVFLLIMSIGCLSREDAEVIKVLSDHLGDEFKKFTIVIFTHKDKLVLEKIKLEDYIKTLPANVKKFLSGLNRNYMAFENRDKESKQVKTLIEMIVGVVTKNQGLAFSAKPSHEKHQSKYLGEFPKLAGKIRAGQLIQVAEAMESDKRDEADFDLSDENDMDIKIQLLHMKEKVRMKEIETTHKERKSRKQQEDIDGLNNEILSLQEIVRNKDKDINEMLATDKQHRQQIADMLGQLSHEQEQIRCRDRFIQDLIMELKLTKNKHHRLHKKYGETSEKLALFSRQKIEEAYNQTPSRPTTSMNKSMPTCTICCDRQIESFVIPCGHAFCMVCISECGERYKKCPKCRRRFKNYGTLYV